jgi:hypothetical protein
MRNPSIPGWCLLALTGCSAAPTEGPHTASESSAVVQTIQGVPYQTLDLGAASDVLCVVQSVSGLMHGYCTPTPPTENGMPTVCDPTAAAAGTTNAALGTGFVLYVDDAQHWQLYAEGQPFGVTAACIPWRGLGIQAPAGVVRVDTGLVPESTTPGTMSSSSSPIQGACVLSSATDSYDRGASAQVTSNSLTVSGSAFLWASATCVNGLNPADFPVGTHLPSNAFCGLSKLGDMSQTDSAVSAAGPVVTAVHAKATARCFPTL